MKSSREWRFGAEGERIVNEWLKKNGYLVVPTSLIETGGAPMLSGWIKRAVLPDTQAFREGCGRWVEVKTKGESIVYKKEVRTGFSLRLYRQYEEVERETGMPCYIAFVHRKERELAIGTLGNVTQIVEEYLPKYKGPMAFWRVDTLERYTLEGGAVAALDKLAVPPKVTYPWSGSTKAGPQQFTLGFQNGHPGIRKGQQ